MSESKMNKNNKNNSNSTDKNYLAVPAIACADHACADRGVLLRRPNDRLPAPKTIPVSAWTVPWQYRRR